MAKKLSSLSIFFPFYNDAGTVRRMVDEAYTYGQKLTSDLEVIAIHGGASSDETWREITLAKRAHPKLRVINRADNTQGYAVINSGFKAAKKDWIFYTDGDGQYTLKDLAKLVALQSRTQADVVNGFKQKRQDLTIRKVLGKSFERLYTLLVPSPITDIHCDFRLIRQSYVHQIRWQTSGANVISELILKVQAQGAVFAETMVHHQARKYGDSNYSWYQLTLESCQELFWSLKYTYLTRFKL